MLDVFDNASVSTDEIVSLIARSTKHQKYIHNKETDIPKREKSNLPKAQVESNKHHAWTIGELFTSA